MREITLPIPDCLFVCMNHTCHPLVGPQNIHRVASTALATATHVLLCRTIIAVFFVCTFGLACAQFQRLRFCLQRTSLLEIVL